jgi:Family of unknown function (DUF6636)
VKRAVLLAVIVSALVPAGASAYRLRLFHVPGGNIGCSLIFGSGSYGGGARCDIAHHAWKSPPRPHWCDLDYGDGLTVGAHGRAKFVCAGDTTLHQGKVLRVGRAAKLGPFKCRSLPGAVRCVNRDSGHGFRLSRTVARRF